MNHNHNIGPGLQRQLVARLLVAAITAIPIVGFHDCMRQFAGNIDGLVATETVGVILRDGCAIEVKALEIRR